MSTSRSGNNGQSPDQEPANSLTNSLTEKEIRQAIEALHRSDRSLHNMQALEVWAIAETMDKLLPGFWSRFMANRQIAMKQLMQERRTRRQNRRTLDEHDR